MFDNYFKIAQKVDVEKTEKLEPRGVHFNPSSRITRYKSYYMQLKDLEKK